MAFPLDFGFIPSTKGEDHDPIDVLILAETALPVGCLVEVRLIGLIEAMQTESDAYGMPKKLRNDRLVARIDQSRAFADIEEIEQLGDSFCEELARFFGTYNALKNRSFEVIATRGADAAVQTVQNASVSDR